MSPNNPADKAPLADRVKDAAAAQPIPGNELAQPAPKGQTVFDLVRAQQPGFEKVLAGTINAERFTRVAITVLRQNRNLAECEPASLLGALMICAQLGLEPGGPLGQAYLVPYKRQVTFIVGYKGLIALALRSGTIASVKASPVFAGDHFEWELGLHERLEHHPDITNPNRTDPARLIYVYAIARFKDRNIDPMFVVLSRAEIDATRNRSASKDRGPWTTDYTAMALKTAVRRLATWLPMATDLNRAAAADDKPITSAHTDVDDFIDLEEIPPAAPPFAATDGNEAPASIPPNEAGASPTAQ